MNLAIIFDTDNEFQLERMNPSTPAVTSTQQTPYNKQQKQQKRGRYVQIQIPMENNIFETKSNQALVEWVEN